MITPSCFSLPKPLSQNPGLQDYRITGLRLESKQASKQGRKAVTNRNKKQVKNNPQASKGSERTSEQARKGRKQKTKTKQQQKAKSKAASEEVLRNLQGPGES